MRLEKGKAMHRETKGFGGYNVEMVGDGAKSLNQVRQGHAGLEQTTFLMVRITCSHLPF